MVRVPGTAGLCAVAAAWPCGFAGEEADGMMPLAMAFSDGLWQGEGTPKVDQLILLCIRRAKDGTTYTCKGKV